MSHPCVDQQIAAFTALQNAFAEPPKAVEAKDSYALTKRCQVRAEYSRARLRIAGDFVHDRGDRRSQIDVPSGIHRVRLAHMNCAICIVFAA